MLIIIKCKLSLQMNINIFWGTLQTWSIPNKTVINSKSAHMSSYRIPPCEPLKSSISSSQMLLNIIMPFIMFIYLFLGLPHKEKLFSCK